MANLLPLLLSLPSLNIISFSNSVTVFISIDCGATDGHVDENNIRLVGDDQYIKTGEKHVAISANNTVMSTLRVFSSPKKNCYTIGIEQGTRILVRAGFFYGNYDKQSFEPSFDLQLDGNYWNTVTTSIDNVKFYEAIYVPKGNTTSVCVAQTLMGNIPFISSLEVRSLDLDMYSSVGANYPLFLFQRNMMATNGIVRFPDDPYDRIWNPDVAQNGFTRLTTEANISAAVKDKPPTSALRTAVTPADQTSSTSIIYTYTSTRASSGSFYINIYFSEVTKLASTDKRAFEVFVNGKRESAAILPPYLGVVEHTIVQLNSSYSIGFSMVPTSYSTLNPIYNAMEIFLIGDALTNGTDSNDVHALAQLQEKYAQLQAWSGDPCLPSTFNWEWVACSSDPSPRIMTLDLSGLGLEGPFPDISALDALQIIDMHNNNFNGEIPDFLGTLPNLKELNLADNNFSGSIPLKISKNRKLNLEISGNPYLCASGNSCGSSGSPPNYQFNSPSSGVNSPNSYFNSPNSVNTIGTSSSYSSMNLPVTCGTLISSFSIVWLIVGHVHN